MAALTAAIERGVLDIIDTIGSFYHGMTRFAPNIDMASIKRKRSFLVIEIEGIPS
jgi:hypothetical protein